MLELAPRLWRWTARHPEWRPGAESGSTADWPAEVGSVAYAAPGGFVLIDPLVPEGDEGAALLEALDERVRAHPGTVSVLTTLKWHRRSRDRLTERYGASTSRARGALPPGVEPLPIRGAAETMFWLSEPRALVPGDRLIGDGAGGLRTCPQSWLSYLGPGADLARLRQSLRPLLELPIESVLVSHGEAVLHGGHEALAQALRRSAEGIRHA